MEDSTFEELDRINTAIVVKDGKIQRINFSPLLTELYIHNDQVIRTPAIIEFMSTLTGKAKTSGKNGISRLQTFLNAYVQETALKYRNGDILKFINNDHDFLERGGHGENDAEFYFTPKSGKTYRLEAKMYWDEASFREKLPKTNFHDAEYVCLFFIKDSNYRWAFAKKEDNYEKIYRQIELAETDPYILEIRLQSPLVTISFAVNSDAADADVPEEITYRFYNN